MASEGMTQAHSTYPLLDSELRLDAVIVFLLERALSMGHGGSIDPGHGLCRNDFYIETALQVRLQGRLEELDSFIRG